MQHTIAACPFCGRPKQDKLAHFIKCGPIWNILRSEFDLPTFLSVKTKLCLSISDAILWYKTAAASYAFHRLYQAIQHSPYDHHAVQRHLRVSKSILIKKSTIFAQLFRRRDLHLLRSCFMTHSSLPSSSTSTSASSTSSSSAHYRGPVDASMWPILSPLTIAFDGSAAHSRAGWGFTVARLGQATTLDYCGSVYDAGHVMHIGADVHTNNTAELSGLFATLRWIKRFGDAPVTIQYDSEYAIGVARGHLRPRRNLNLVLKVPAALLEIRTALHFQKIRAHSGHVLNDHADILAKHGAAGHELNVDISWYLL